MDNYVNWHLELKDTLWDVITCKLLHSYLALLMWNIKNRNLSSLSQLVIYLNINPSSNDIYAWGTWPFSDYNKCYLKAAQRIRKQKQSFLSWVPHLYKLHKLRSVNITHDSCLSRCNSRCFAVYHTVLQNLVIWNNKLLFTSLVYGFSG